MTPTREELEAAFCWEADDDVRSRPSMTAFRREARYHQARWREAHHHPIGTQPINPRPGDTKVRPVGSRLPLDYGRETGANFLTSAALDAARARSAYIEACQSVDHQRLWADLLSSVALSFNLFGDLAADVALADRAVHHWFPDTPGRVSEVHPSERWTWGRCVAVHPAKNTDAVDACSRYRSMLADDATFATMTLEQLLDTDTVPRPTTTALRHRYLPE